MMFTFGGGVQNMAYTKLYKSGFEQKISDVLIFPSRYKPIEVMSTYMGISEVIIYLQMRREYQHDFHDQRMNNFLFCILLLQYRIVYLMSKA